MKEPIITPEEIRKLRAWMCSTKEELASLLGVTLQTYSGWERQDSNGPSAPHSLALRNLNYMRLKMLEKINGVPSVSHSITPEELHQEFSLINNFSGKFSARLQEIYEKLDERLFSLGNRVALMEAKLEKMEENNGQVFVASRAIKKGEPVYISENGVKLQHPQA